MQSFIEQVVENVNRKYGEKIHELTVVFPNRRAGIFFRDALSRHVSRPMLAPQILTYEEFVYRLSPLRYADKLTLVYVLYDVFQQTTDIRESFDRFFHWGEMLLHDFDEIDKWQVNAQDLFSNIQDIKELEAHFDYLTAEQIEVITRFWKNFTRTSSHTSFSDSKEQFIRLWSRLFDVYTSFRGRLREMGLAYEGMILREVAEQADRLRLETPDTAVVFAGFNAFSRAEEKIVSWFVGEKEADIYWDVDALYVQDKQQEAGTFFRRYLQHKVLKYTFERPLPDHFTQGLEKKMRIVATTLEVGQAKKLGEMLEELAADPTFNPEKTVIVLPDEHLLFPVLHSLPESIRRINVTMGYPLRKTPLYSLLEDLLQLQEEKRYNETRKEFEFHHTSVLSVLKHPYLVQYRPELAFENVRDIAAENKVYIRLSELKGNHVLFPLIFRPVQQVQDMFDYLRNILTHIHSLVEVKEEKPEEEADEEEIILPNLEQELIYHFYIQLNRLKAIAEEYHFQLSLPIFLRLFRQILQSVRVPFTGEPLRGLQIMGVLETRNLDFDNVFILSMNEGIYPPSDPASSFVPGSLRKGFGLPTQDYQDALYSYTFFRLLQKAKNVCCFYNTEDLPQMSGEPSRFLYQLLYESDRLPDGQLRYPQGNGKLMIRQHTLAIPVHAIPAPRLTIAKSGEVMKSLSRFLKTGQEKPNRLTPSALNTYLDCRLKFYFKYVAGLEETEALQADIDPAVFGNILHKTMEVVYRNYMDEHKTHMIAQDVSRMLKGERLHKALAIAFREHFRIEEDQGFVLEGKNVIAREIIIKMANRILDLDAQYAPFEILGLEQRDYFLDMTVKDEKNRELQVPLKGIVDRIDRKGAVVRVLDYKTGRDEKQIRDIASLFDRNDPRRNKAAMQAMFYALLYLENSKKNENVVPGLINAKNIFEEPFDPRFFVDKNVVNDFGAFEAAFVQQLDKLLLELFDETVPFDQTEDTTKCSYCPYAGICF